MRLPERLNVLIVGLKEPVILGFCTCVVKERPLHRTDETAEVLGPVGLGQQSEKRP